MAPRGDERSSRSHPVHGDRSVSVRSGSFLRFRPSSLRQLVEHSGGLAHSVPPWGPEAKGGHVLLRPTGRRQRPQQETHRHTYQPPGDKS
eukprot:6390729-Pyramimonas_sp.AAC.1